MSHDSALVGRVRARGLRDNHEGQEAFTCNANAEAKWIAFGQNLPTHLALDATDVYWIDAMSVMKAPVIGGAVTQLASGQSEPTGIAVDATGVYWTDYAGGTTMKLSLSGGAPVTLATAQTGPNFIAVDAARVYWTSDAGTVQAMPISGGAATTLA